MTTTTLYWDAAGDDEQVFELGNVREITKEALYNTTFRMIGFEPGVPYTFETSVYNRYTNQTVVQPESNVMWFTSELGDSLFQKEHAQLYRLSSVQYTDGPEGGHYILVQMEHTLSSQTMDTLQGHSIKFDLYAEPSPSSADQTSICSHTYPLDIQDVNEEFVISNINSDTQYQMYFSLAVAANVDADSWKYVLVHQPFHETRFEPGASSERSLRTGSLDPSTKVLAAHAHVPDDFQIAAFRASM